MNASTEVKREQILDELGWQLDEILRHVPLEDADALRHAVVRRGNGEPDAIEYILGDGVLTVRMAGDVAYALQANGAGALRYTTNDEGTHVVELFHERARILGPEEAEPPAEWSTTTT